MTVSFAEGLVGLTLDERYRLDAVLGEGGMGAVFRATHLAMDRKVAVKMLKPHLSNNEQSLERFKREARSTMKVDSPHAVKVLDYGITPLKDYYMVLEYLDGRTVQRELDVDGIFTPPRVVHIARQALHALAAAHAIGLVHRDIKPENILLMRAGADADYTKLLDFGVAKLMEGAAKSSQSALALTQVGTVFGTPEFMSPEQACGHPLDGRSDLYSLAATMFAMLTGCGMFDAGSAIEWLTNHVRTPAPHLADVSPELASYPELDEVLQACLAKARDKRPASAGELDRLLQRIESTLTRPAGKTPGTSKVKVFSSSTFFEALPLETVDPGQTLLPSAGMSLEQIQAAAPSVESDVLPVRSRRGIYLGIGALVVLGVISVAIGVIMSKKKGETPIDAAVAKAPPDAAPVARLDAAPVATDAAIAVVIDAAPAPPIDAAVVVRPTGGSSERPKNTVALKHLAEAESAFASKAHPMVQMGAAQLALENDPQNLLRPDQKLRAKFLFGDALLRTDGNFERGCAYLRALKNVVAINQAKARGCPN